MRFFKDTENVFSSILFVMFFLPWTKDGNGIDLFKDGFASAGDPIGMLRILLILLPFLCLASIAMNVFTGKGRLPALVAGALGLLCQAATAIRYMMSQAEIQKLQIASLVPGSVFSYLQFGFYLSFIACVFLVLAALKVVKIKFEVAD